MSKTKTKILHVITLLLIITMTLHMGSPLRPYLTLFLAVAMLIVSILYFKHKQSKILFTTLLFLILFSVAYIFFPVKFIIESNQDQLFSVVPVGYGLPNEEGWSQIDQGLFYPGGDVTGPFNPKHVIIVGY